MARTSDELSKHCQRKTHGAEETMKATKGLVLQFTPATGSLGEPVFR